MTTSGRNAYVDMKFGQGPKLGKRKMAKGNLVMLAKYNVISDYLNLLDLESSWRTLFESIFWKYRFGIREPFILTKPAIALKLAIELMGLFWSYALFFFGIIGILLVKRCRYQQKFLDMGTNNYIFYKKVIFFTFSLIFYRLNWCFMFHGFRNVLLEVCTF